MQISRRDLLRSSAVVAGGTALLGGLGGLSAEAVAGPAARSRQVVERARTTRRAVLVRGPEGPGGYRPVVAAKGEPWLVRSDLGTKAKAGRAKRRKPLLAFAQVSDVHIVDSESPMRVEYADPFSSSAYRPQEFLTLHVAEAMVQGINSVKTGPATGKPIAFTLQTGDNADNAQYNEVRWNIDVLDGGPIQPDSGDHTKTESTADNSDPAFYFTKYWHPEGTPDGLADDDARSTYGFPTIPGLLAKARAPFDATGLAMPWFSVMGNHDKLVQGNAHPAPDNQARATGNRQGDRHREAAHRDRRPRPTRAQHRRDRRRALHDHRSAGRARLHPAEPRRGHGVLHVRPGPGPLRRHGHRQCQRRRRGLAEPDPARLDQGPPGRLEAQAGGVLQPPPVVEHGQRGHR